MPVRPPNGAASKFVPTLKHIRIGDLLIADTDLDGRAVVADEIVELFEQIILEEGRLRNSRCVDARSLELGIGALLDWWNGRGPIDDPKFRIAELRALLRGRRDAGREKAFQRMTLRVYGGIIQSNQPRNGLIWCRNGHEGGNSTGSTGLLSQGLCPNGHIPFEDRTQPLDETTSRPHALKVEDCAVII